MLFCFANGIHGTSTFSGMSGWESGLTMMVEGLSEGGFEPPAGSLYLHSFSDIKKDSRALALQGRVSAREGCVVIGSTHVFGNIQGRLGEVWGKVHKCK